MEIPTKWKVYKSFSRSKRRLPCWKCSVYASLPACLWYPYYKEKPLAKFNSIPPWLVHFSLNLWHLLNVKHWQYSHWNVLVMDICIVRNNLEKLAWRQNSECCNADFWPIRRKGLSWNFEVLQWINLNESFRDFLYTLWRLCEEIFKKLFESFRRYSRKR